MSEIHPDRELDSRANLPTGGKFARARFFVPDAITSLNLLSGCVSMVSAFEGHFERAALLVEFSIACDILDGLFARASHTATKFGIEYDSLADLVAFGVAPASLVYSWALMPHGLWSIGVMASFIVCAALRLARFNIQSATTAGKTRFVGLPVPAAAAMIAGSLFCYDYFDFDFPRVLCVSMAAVTVALARIMVSRIPYPALKSFDPSGSRTRIGERDSSRRNSLASSASACGVCWRFSLFPIRSGSGFARRTDRCGHAHL